MKLLSLQKTYVETCEERYKELIQEDQGWYEGYQHLVAFTIQEGHADVPHNPSLSWLEKCTHIIQ